MNPGKYFHLFLIPVIFLMANCNRNFENALVSEGSYVLNKVYDLPNELSESSGIIIYDSLIWSFNDSRNDPVLYGLDMATGTIQKVLHLIQADNIDWEDIAQDSNYIFIGDFGNNYGNRQDLSIYRIRKDDIKDYLEQMVAAERINFTYEDQKDFTFNYKSTPFDCEALLCDGDSLILFTKDWLDEQTTLYKLPINPGTYEARRCIKMDSKGLITGADYNSESETLMLCGYQNYIPFVLIETNFNSFCNINFNMIRIDLFEDYGVQLEGITSFNETLYLSSEYSIDNQALYTLAEQ